MYQFGFKTGHSAGLYTNILKQTVNHYTTRGSHVFVCFIYFRKAYDKVNYWKLFNMLLDDDIPLVLVYLLAYWYNHQEMCVKWNFVISGCFTVTNGTRQGGVLSHCMFSRYIRGLIHNVASSHVGCSIGNIPVSILAYADDIVLLSPSWRGLQYLIDCLSLCTKDIDMLCNERKTVCMVFSSQILMSFSPMFKLGTSDLQFVSLFRYLGHIISNCLCDNDDIQREIKNIFYTHQHFDSQIQ